jgi:hypothetical protein
MSESAQIFQDRKTDVTLTEVRYGMEAMRMLYDYYVDNDDMEKANALNEAYYIFEAFAEDSEWVRKDIA